MSIDARPKTYTNRSLTAARRRGLLLVINTVLLELELSSVDNSHKYPRFTKEERSDMRSAINWLHENGWPASVKR